MARPDLYAAFRALDPHERDLVLRWARELGVEVEDLPPLRSLLEAVAVARFAASRPDLSREAAFRKGAERIGHGWSDGEGAHHGGDTIRRRVDAWRSRSSGRNLRAGPEGAGEVEVAT